MNSSKKGAMCSDMLVPSRRALNAIDVGNCCVAARAVQEQELAGDQHKPGLTTMQTFFFDMKDGVPLRDREGIEFMTTAEAIGHCKELAQHFRDESLRDDKELEISVVNASGREIHREHVHRE